MFPIRKILCPTDFSEPSLLAIDAAIELAGITDAEIILIHAVSPLPLAPYADTDTEFDKESYLELMLAQGKEAMKRVIEKIPDSVPVRSLVLSGNPSKEITRTAEDEKVNLIVIATHGLTGWRRFVFGSVAEKVVRLSPCPVMTIPAPEERE